MKILERGRPKENWTMQHHCKGWGNTTSGCNALLEIEYDDLTYCYIYSSQTFRPAVMFDCPCCGNSTEIERENWPQNYENIKRLSRKPEKYHISVDIFAK